MVKLPPDPLSALEMSILDENCTSLGIPKSLLMESAGCQAAELLFNEFNLDQNTKVGIFCGPGNNGGDGFVIARHLASRGVPVQVIFVGDQSKIHTPEAKLNWAIIHRLPLNIFIYNMIDSLNEKSVEQIVQEDKLIVDCLLGNGVTGRIRQPISSAIDLINRLKIPVACIDIPTGIDPTKGNIVDKVVRCDLLLTFHRNKTGILNMPNRKVLPIGIPVEASIFVGDGDLMYTLTHRIKTSHKGQYGNVLVIGGSSSYSGAPSFSAMAALEFGVDLCIALVPKSIGSVVRSYSPSIIVREGTSDILTPDDIPLAKKIIGWADAILIGPGIGQDSNTEQFFNQIMPLLIESKKPVVIDADGLKLLGKYLNTEKRSLESLPIVLTPHLGELQALAKCDLIPAYDAIEARGNFLHPIAEKIGGIILLKGVYDYIVDALSYRVNTTGCAEMSVGGTGDVLAGLVVAFMSIGVSPKMSACCAAYLNGIFGELAQAKHGHRIQAMDLIAEIRPYLKSKNL